MIRNLISIILYLLCISTVTADNVITDKRNLSYASARIKVLPLLKLSPQTQDLNNNLIFIHPPKVSGTNIVYVIDAMKNVNSHRFSVPRIKDVSPGLITKGWIGGLASLKEQCTGSNKTECSEYNFISGHFPYGAHNYLNNKYKYITLICHPLEREISSVNFDYQRGYIQNKQNAVHLLLNIMIDNPQTRLIAGEEYMSGECNKQTLKVAKRNLKQHFLFAGVVEDCNIFIQVLISMLGKEPVAMGKSQVTYDKIIIEPSKDLRNALLRKHQYDVALYEYVKKGWTKWKRKHILGNIPIVAAQKILTITPDFANTHEASYMTTSQVKQYNLSHSKNEVLQIKQHHHGLKKDIKKRDK